MKIFLGSSRMEVGAHRKGVHEVTEDLFIPRRFTLVIERGTSLKFSRDTVMISEGAIIANGPRRTQSYLRPQGTHGAAL